MYTKWTSHIKDPEAKKDFEAHIISAKPVLDRQKDILAEEERALDRSELDVKSFSNPNWPNLQAYKFGYRAALGFMTKLTDLDKQETT